MKRSRLKPEVRKEIIITAALKLATEWHFLKVTRGMVAEDVGVAPATIQYHFKNMDQFRKELMRAAVKQECLPVIAQGLLMGNNHARKASPELKQRAVESVGI